MDDRDWARSTRYLAALLAATLALGAVALLDASVGELPTVVLLYQVPIILAASRWGRGPAIAAAVASILGHDVLFVTPRFSLHVASLSDALGLALLLFTALVTAQLADQARRGADIEREAAVVRQSDALKTALLRAVSHHLRTPLASIKASVSTLRQSDAVYSDED